MKTLIIDGSHTNDPQAVNITNALRKHLPDAETIILREQKIGNCAGDFYCWVRNPGMCNTDDDNRVIAAKIMQSDLVINLTPITFGGYSSELKRMVDHQIQNISPFFTHIQGEVHHKKRYKRYPNLLTIGWMDEPNMQAEAIFRHLVHRNAINFHAKTSVCGLVIGKQTQANLDPQVENWIKDIERGTSSSVPDLPAQTFTHGKTAPIKHATLLIGSPRMKKSTSSSLGHYLFEKLSEHGIETQTTYLYTTLNSRERMKALLETLDNTDLIVLASPLYVDSLPAPVTLALERISKHRQNNQKHIRFAAISNCGFPEAKHNNTALAIASEFSHQNRLEWMGGLALGAGEGIVHGSSLNELDGRAIPIKKSLELAADALADGEAIPQSAIDLLAKPIIPNWAYVLFGQLGWRSGAKQYGMQYQLKRQPYL